MTHEIHVFEVQFVQNLQHVLSVSTQCAVSRAVERGHIREAGADVVKVFPASAMGGAKYLTALKGPLPQVDLIPTGGVSLATAAEFLAAGAFALGVGSDLVDAKAMAEGKPEKVTNMAKAYLEIVREFRASSAA